MTNRKDNKQSQGDQRKNALKDHPEQIVNNPAMQFSGTSAALSGLQHPDNSVGGGLANSKRLNDVDDNVTDSDYNRAGNLRNQGENEQHANNNVRFNSARPVGKLSGKAGKTMVKNVGMHNNNEANLDETESNI